MSRKPTRSRSKADSSQVILDGETFRAGRGQADPAAPGAAAVLRPHRRLRRGHVRTLRDLVEAELSQPVDPRVAAMAQAIAARHGAASRAVLFYGSCLREQQLDGLMLDFYLIVFGLCSRL